MSILHRFLKCLKNCHKPRARGISVSPPKLSPIRTFHTLVFGKYLLHTNIISSGVLMWLGDLCQQEIEYRQRKILKRYDYGRMTRMFIVGLGLGPIHHYYYLYIAKIMPKRDLSTVFIKIGLDQFFMSPVCIAAFFYSMGMMEMKHLKQMNDEILAKFVDVYVIDWCVWVPTQFINFYIIPVKYQVFYINAVTMLYNVFLSYIKHVDADHFLQEEGLLEKPSVSMLQTSEGKTL
ncbi:mpv17-like protein 2 [Euwallacea similis]|uniref:mpv17-like protein 2 n=1 Tax=Euwallacea similis TaxID=1736056 RepID=UPI00344BBB45